MQRVAVFVDASYLFAEGSFLLTGERQAREFLSLNIPELISALCRIAESVSDLPLLRIYWYDAAPFGRPTQEQARLADADGIKLRLGQISRSGEQKGVDALIITDLAELARNRAFADAVLVSGDEDIRTGVVLAQQFGVRVHLVGVAPAALNQSRSLRQDADTTAEWDASVIGAFLLPVPPTSPAAPGDASAATGLEEAVEAHVAGMSPADLAGLKAWFASNTGVPFDHDRMLLRIGRAHHGRDELNPSERADLRNVFVRVIQAQP